MLVLPLLKGHRSVSRAGLSAERILRYSSCRWAKLPAALSQAGGAGVPVRWTACRRDPRLPDGHAASWPQRTLASVVAQAV